MKNTFYISKLIEAYGPLYQKTIPLIEKMASKFIVTDGPTDHTWSEVTESHKAKFLILRKHISSLVTITRLYYAKQGKVYPITPHLSDVDEIISIEIFYAKIQDLKPHGWIMGEIAYDKAEALIKDIPSLVDLKFTDANMLITNKIPTSDQVADIVKSEIAIQGTSVPAFKDFEANKIYVNGKEIKSQERTLMNKITDSLSGKLTENTDALKLVAKIKIGKAIIKKVMKEVKKLAPKFVRGYLDSPFAELLIVNGIAIAMDTTMPKSKRTTEIKEAMLIAAMDNMGDSFKVDELFTRLLDGIDLSGLDKE